MSAAKKLYIAILVMLLGIIGLILHNSIIFNVVPTNDNEASEYYSEASYLEQNSIHAGNMGESTTSSNYYFVFDTLRSGNSEFVESNELVHRLKKINEMFHEEFSFTELGTQSLYYLGTYTGEKEFTVETQNGLSQINQKAISHSGDTIVTTPLKTTLVGRSLCSNLETAIVEGRCFNDTDFLVYEPNQEINVLLGNKYKSIYAVGDVLNLNLLEKDVTLKVIGFLNEGVSINTTTVMVQKNPTEINLDWAIILPFYDILYEPSNQNELLYQTRFYLQKNCGYIMAESDHEAVLQDIDIATMEKDLKNAGLTHPNLKQYCYYKNAVEYLSLQQNVLFSISLSPVLIEPCV